MTVRSAGKINLEWWVGGVETHRFDCDVLRNVDIDYCIALANRPSNIVLDNISLVLVSTFTDYIG